MNSSAASMTASETVGCAWIVRLILRLWIPTAWRRMLRPGFRSRAAYDVDARISSYFDSLTTFTNPPLRRGCRFARGGEGELAYFDIVALLACLRFG